MTKVVLNDISSGYAVPGTINANNAAIEEAFDNTLSRDGTAPNDMEANIDMNGRKVINSGAATNATDLVRLGDLPVPSVEEAILTAELIGDYIFPETTGETNAGVTPDTAYGSAPYDLRRILVPNSVGSRAANTAALKALLDPEIDGPTGLILFTNETGADIYYFGVDFADIRDGVTLDGQGCTLNINGAYDANMDSNGFFNLIRNVTIQNCNFDVDYDGSSGINNGMILRVGARAGSTGSGFGEHRTALGLEEEDLTSQMGNCIVRNCRFVTNNTTHMIGALGGLHNVLFENNVLDGGNAAITGFSYEFGQFHYEGGAAGGANISAHAINLRYINNVVENIDGEAAHITGAMTCFVDGLFTKNCETAFQARCGEALYYNMTGTPTEGMKAHYDLRGIYGDGHISIVGAESAASGYLATDIGLLDADARRAAQVDKISFNLDGFYVETGHIVVSGRHVRVANGTQTGNGTAGGSGGVIMQDELTSFDFDNVHILDNTSTGFRSQAGSAVPAMTIVDATSASPIEFTTAVDHGLATGRVVRFASLPGDFAALNAGTHSITVTGTDTFTVAVNGAAFAAYTSGGTAALLRYKRGKIANSFIAGNTGAGVALGDSYGVQIDTCRFGYELSHDGVSEATQTAGVSNATTSFHTTVSNCHGGGLASGSMYTNSGSGGWKDFRIINCSGIATLSGDVMADGGGEHLAGDADLTITAGFHLPTVRYATTLTANRTVTLSTTNFQEGDRFKFIRTGLGAFTLAIGSLKTIPSATAAVVEIEFDGSAWVLSGYQLL